MADVKVIHNADERRYEAHVDDQLTGFIDYRAKGEALNLRHTEVFPQFGGQGIGGQLVRGALDQAREAGKKVVPTCPFIADFIEKHRDYADLVA